MTHQRACCVGHLFRIVSRLCTSGPVLQCSNITHSYIQGYSPGLERLGLKTFLERLALVSVLKVEGLGLVSVSRVWKNLTSQSRLGLEDITSRSRDFSLVNIHAVHQACGYIRKKIIDLIRKKQLVK